MGVSYGLGSHSVVYIGTYLRLRMCSYTNLPPITAISRPHNPLLCITYSLQSRVHNNRIGMPMRIPMLRIRIQLRNPASVLCIVVAMLESDIRYRSCTRAMRAMQNVRALRRQTVHSAVTRVCRGNMLIRGCWEDGIHWTVVIENASPSCCSERRIASVALSARRLPGNSAYTRKVGI